jgi:putative tricarboxylic transport membrane protein
VTREGRLGGILVSVFAAAYLAVGFSIPTASVGDPLGPTAFPVLLGTLMGLLGLSLVVVPDQAERGGREARSWGTVAALAGLLGLYGYTLPIAGYPLGTFCFLGVTAYLLGERSWRLLLGLASVVSLGIYLLFTQALDVPLPLGVLEYMKG